LISVFDPAIPSGMASKTKNSKKSADKKLLEAAPHLLAACYSILNTLEEMELGDIGALDDVREAISIATGKTICA
jgi:hypothetical protein